MAERKNTEFDRPGGYAMPKGATAVQRAAAREMIEAKGEASVRLFGDAAPLHSPASLPNLKPAFQADDPDTRLYVGDCRDVLANIPDKGQVDLIFADPPFNWDVPYESWADGMPRREYERFTFDWLDGCIEALAPHGSLWVNIPDDTAAECVIHLKRRGLTMINWCIWHFRFGQNRDSSFIMSKVHALYFAKCADVAKAATETKRRRDGETKRPLDDNRPDGQTQSLHLSVSSSLPTARTWNPNAILELSDRASIYADKRTMEKDSNKGMRVPMDVWYGKYWGRIQGNNKERRHNHHNQIPEVYLERVIKACSNPGDLVLDPFAGSGTTSTVARALGRRSITIEHSEVNARSAWERITKVGMVKREDDGPQSTAIFASRRKGERKSGRKKAVAAIGE